MVIGERFAWCHMQKTAGDLTLQLFQLFPDLIVSADARNVQEKHTPFAERQREIEGKLLVCNLRRLPSWTLSWDQHHSLYRSVRPDGRPVLMSSPQQMAERRRGDRRLAHFTDGGRMAIDRWLRMEHLPEDFIAFISDFTTVTDEQRDRIASHPPVNEIDYDHELGHWFTPEQVRLMYASNPVWAALEECLYGELVSLD